MLADIRRQPAVLAGLLGRASELRAFGRHHLRPGPGGSLTVAGCGDGWFAARAVAGLAGQGYRARSALPFLVYDAAGLGPGDRVLMVSMSGQVDRMVEAAEAALAAGAAVALLTNGDGGRLGALGLPRVSLDIDPLAPFLCGTSSYTASLLALMLALSQSDREIEAELTTLIAGLAEVLASAEREVAAPAAADAGVRFLSCGVNLASADYGAAKLVELTRLPAWSDDIEEFAHRQFWSAQADELIVFLAANPEVARIADRSAAALGTMGFTTLALEAAGCAVPEARHRVTLPAVEESLSPLVVAPPLQLLGYYLALASGLDPNTRRHLKDDTLRFSISRALTRRSLLGTGQ
jgi:fructoselysine-6-P-deglycase FrlB-like protein